MEAGRESRGSGEVAAYSDARTSVIATSPSSELRPLMPNFAQQQFRAEHVSVGSKTEVSRLARRVRFTLNSRRRAPRRLVCDRESARQHEVGRQLRWDHLRHPIAKARQVDACEQGFTAAQNDG